MLARPRAVSIIGWIFVVFGTIALVGGAYWLIREISAGRTAQLEAQLFRELVPIGITWILALVGGLFLLRGAGWARWLLIAWAAFHVLLSVFHPPVELAVHMLILAAIAYFLFRPAASAYFRAPASAESTTGVEP